MLSDNCTFRMATLPWVVAPTSPRFSGAITVDDPCHTAIRGCISGACILAAPATSMPPPEGPPPSELATSSAVDSEDFVASSSFSGPRQGFIFKTDEKGTGGQAA